MAHESRLAFRNEDGFDQQQMDPPAIEREDLLLGCDFHLIET